MTLFGLFFIYFGGLYMSNHKFENGILLLSGLTTIAGLVMGIGLFWLSQAKDEEIEELVIKVVETKVLKEKEEAPLITVN
jgi:hypothetical protein